jgi:thiol-disulfide isomerase/thioredoxin
MNKFKILSLVVLLLLPLSLWAETGGRGPAAPEVVKAFKEAGLPLLARKMNPTDFSLPLLNGENRKLSDLQGKVVFLNFWATWCGPCRAEMPAMEALHRRFKDRGFEILAVNCQEKREQAAAFMQDLGLSFPVALDGSGQISSAYGIRAIPTTYILDRQGSIIARIVGSLNWEEPKILAAFEALLSQ